MMLSYSSQDGRISKNIQDLPRLVQEELVVKLLAYGNVEIEYSSIHAIVELLNAGVYTKPRRMSLSADWEIVCEVDRLTLRQQKELHNISCILQTNEGTIDIRHPEV